MADQQQAPGLLANILAVAGFILLIVIIVWGAYHLLRLTGSGVSSLFSRFSGEDAVAITVPESAVESGRSFPISWEYDAEGDGSYAFLYRCTTGFRFSLPAANGTAGTAIPCGSAFSVGDATSLTVIPTLSGTTSADVPLTVVFMPSATSTEERPQGTASVRVVSAATNGTGGTNGTSQPSTPNIPSTPSMPSTEQPVGGTPDLSVKILAVGVIDMYGNFVQRTPMGPHETAAVQFDIRNDGTAASGTYHFNVQLPTQPILPYVSPMQASLAPGAHVVSTLRFGPVAPGGGTISVEVDASRKVSDSDRSDNAAAVWMNASGYPYQYGMPFVY